jgi:hypothetical protein
LWHLVVPFEKCISNDKNNYLSFLPWTKWEPITTQTFLSPAFFFATQKENWNFNAKKKKHQFCRKSLWYGSHHVIIHWFIKCNYTSLLERHEFTDIDYDIFTRQCDVFISQATDRPRCRRKWNGRRQLTRRGESNRKQMGAGGDQLILKFIFALILW